MPGRMVAKLVLREVSMILEMGKAGKLGFPAFHAKASSAFYK